VSALTRRDRTKIRVSLASIRRESARVQRSLPIALIVAALALAGACGNDRLQRASDDVSVVSGVPSVGTGLPGVDRSDAGPDGGVVYGSAAPFQVDTFAQQTVQQVDILWIIDNSSSMDVKQARVKANFVTFMQFLLQQQIDFHLGVVTTDIYDPTQSGRLVNLAGLKHPWIAATDPAPASEFVLNASVGTSGSGDEKPLLGGMLALTAPLSPATPALPDAGAANCAPLSDGGIECFLRPNAPLYTIVLSDEEDSSCSPIYSSGANSSEGCDDATAALSGYGSIEYWSRFYSGAVGATNTSRLAAIVANEDTENQCATVFAHDCDQFGVNAACGAGTNPACAPGDQHACCVALNACYADIQSKAQWCANHFLVVHDPSSQAVVSPYFQLSGAWTGCVSYAPDGGVDFTAFSADRTAGVAAATGGVATSICQSDYTPALANLGLAAAGLRTDFPLSRAPVEGSISVTVGGVAAASNSWTYERCSGTTPTNVIHFAAPPAAGVKVVASYYVNVRGLGTCP